MGSLHIPDKYLVGVRIERKSRSQHHPIRTLPVFLLGARL